MKTLTYASKHDLAVDIGRLVVCSWNALKLRWKSVVYSSKYVLVALALVGVVLESPIPRGRKPPLPPTLRHRLWPSGLSESALPYASLRSKRVRYRYSRYLATYIRYVYKSPDIDDRELGSVHAHCSLTWRPRTSDPRRPSSRSDPVEFNDPRSTSASYASRPSISISFDRDREYVYIYIYILVLYIYS